MASKAKQASSLTSLAKSLDTRKREPPILVSPRGGAGRGEGLKSSLIRSKLEQKPAVLPPKPALPSRLQPIATSVPRAGALASMQRSPSPVPLKVPLAQKPTAAATTSSDPRRSYPRAEIHVRARLSLADEPSRFFEATLPTLNLSVGGMFLESSFFLKIGTKLHVTLQLPQKGREVKVKAEVVRVESNVLGSSGFALRFTEYLDGSQVTLATHFLSPVLREFLSQYAKEHRFQASAEYLAHTADVLAAWELKKAELGGDVWDLFSVNP